jgi:threonylcarbamoyladenosine tRNA methylthiotransferase MtaB
MVGFPGETEEDFRKSYDLVAELGFSRLHVFPYSAHPGTPAAKMSEQVPTETAKQRSRRLQKLGKELEQRFKDSFQGSELDVVVENVTTEKMRGTTQYYFDIDFTASDVVSYYEHKKVTDPQRLIGKIIRVKL